MLKEILDIGRQVAARIKVTPSSKQDYFQMGLLAKNIEILRSIVHLTENELFGTIPILIRSMLEGVVDLKMAQVEESYLRSLVARDYELTYKAVNYLERNPDSEILSLMFPTEEAIKRAKDDHAYVTEKVKEFDVKRYSIFTAFENIGEGDFYYSIYNYLCRYTHNNPDQIAKSYFVTENGQLKTIKVFKSYTDSELKIFDILAGRLFYRMLANFCQYFNIDCKTELSSIDRLVSDRNNAHGA